MGVAAVTYMRSWQDFDILNLAILPMFLFSATFFPLSTYPDWLEMVIQATPLYHGVDLLRSLTTGTVGAAQLVQRRLPDRARPHRHLDREQARREAAADLRNRSSVTDESVPNGARSSFRYASALSGGLTLSSPSAAWVAERSTESRAAAAP